MNTLEILLGIVPEKESIVASQFQYGAYLIIRHNTLDKALVEDQFERIYRLIFTAIKEAKPLPSGIVNNKRMLQSKTMASIINYQMPVMASTLELKQSPTKSNIFSHHFVYGTHWSFTSSERDSQFGEDLDGSISRYIDTVPDTGNNVLVQPIGQNDVQANDRPTDCSIHRYFRSSQDNPGEDNLLNYMSSISIDKSGYPLTYTYQS